MMLLALLLQASPSWFNVPTVIMGFILLIVTVGSAVIILRSRKREENSLTQSTAVAAWKDAAGGFEAQYKAEKVRAEAAEKKVGELEEEVKTLETAYAAVGGVNMKETLNYATHWREHKLLLENAELRRRLEVHETSS